MSDEAVIEYLKRNRLFETFATAAGVTVGKDATVGDVHKPSATPKPAPAVSDTTKEEEEDAVEAGLAKRLADYTALAVAQDVTFAKGQANLYVSRPLTAGSAQRLHDWAVAQGITNPVPPELMHVTQVRSTAEVEGLEPLSTLVDAGTNRWLAQLGKERCLVMHFSSPELTARFLEAKAAGASWDFDFYRPHITLSYDAGAVNDFMMLDAPDFPIQLGPEEFKANNDNWVKDNKLAKSDDFTFKLDIRKADADQHIIGGWASISTVNGVDVVDLQGDIIPVEELEKAFHEYVLYSRDHGHMHEKRGTGRLIACMTFTPEKAAVGIMAKNDRGEALMGTWVEYLISDEPTWASIKAGELPELSIGGRATPHEV